MPLIFREKTRWHHHTLILHVIHSLPLCVKKAIITAAIILTPYQQALGLPQNFKITQGQIPYEEITSPHFRVYFDGRAPHEGVIISQSLEQIRPIIEKWFQVSRKGRPLRVVSSPVTQHASFANFIYDSLELQTKHHNIRDLTWHEYIHAMTYEFYRNFMGPPGTIFHIMWMPAWFLEGLAEALSVSVGSDYQAGVERWQALTQNWPSYDRLHSLYRNAKWSSRGYATSGSFVSWMLKDLYSSHKNHLSVAQILREFKVQTRPYLLPLNIFDPFKKTLKNRLGHSGKQFYKDYKKQAEAYWKVASPYPLLVKDSSPRHYLPSGKLWIETQKNALIVGNQVDRVHMIFDRQTHWATSTQTLPLPSSKTVGRSALYSGTFYSYIVKLSKQHAHGHMEKNALMVGTNRSSLRPIWKGDQIEKVFHTKTHLGWVVSHLTHTKICTIKKTQVTRFINKPSNQNIRVSCQKVSRPEQRVHILGAHHYPSSKQGEIQALWLRIESSSLTGDLYEIKIWKAHDQKIISKPWHQLAKPISAAFSGKEVWILTSDRTRTYLTQVTMTSLCEKVIHFSDYLLGAWGLTNGSIILRVYEGHQSSLIKIDPKKQIKHPCFIPEPHSSPMLDGMRIQAHYRPKPTVQAPSLEAMITRTHPWKLKHYKESFYQYQKSTQSYIKPTRRGLMDPLRLRSYVKSYHGLTNQVLSHQERHSAHLSSPPFGSTQKSWPPFTSSPSLKRPYSLRLHSPVFFPWLNSSSIRGDQIGLISVPLIDDLQNHLVRGTILFGLDSPWPDMIITYTNTRMRWPVYVSLFRGLLYNGAVLFNKEPTTYYLNELGGQIQLRHHFRMTDFSSLSYMIGWRISHLTNHQPLIRKGYRIKNEPSFKSAVFIRLPLKLKLSLQTAVYAPLRFYNTDFDYYKARVRAGLTRVFHGFGRSTTIEIASTYGHTRGDLKRSLQLKEFYTPILINITGTTPLGNRVTRIRRPIVGNQRFLYRIFFGDTFTRHIASITTELIDDVDKQITIFYAKKLEASFFINWGQAWNSQDSQVFNARKSILAYATAFDLHLENKGVNGFLGLGIGNLVDEGILIYGQVGFSAVF